MSLRVEAPPQEEVRLPLALEEALAFKASRAREVGVELEENEVEDKVKEVEQEERDERRPRRGKDEVQEEEEDKVTPAANPWSAFFSSDDTAIVLPQEEPQEKPPVVEEEPMEEEEEEADEEEEVEDEEVVEAKTEKSKRAKRRKKKKKKKSKADPTTWMQKQMEEERRKREEKRKKSSAPENKVEVQYVQEQIQLDYTNPMYRHFTQVFEKFKIEEKEEPVEVPVKKEDQSKESSKGVTSGDLKKVPKLADEDQDDSDNEEKTDKPKISKRKLKQLQRMSVADLKQTVTRPDVVEMHDVTARFPKLLVHLKASRNTVPVPRHWCFKRKYLQGKRGIEKPPFELPEFIQRTGIMEMRAALQEKEDQKTLKSKMREKVRPKMGKIDIDYQKLHDAFFKWQCKPEMTIHGDLYYEGKEFETKMKDKKPGELSDELRITLGMPVGPTAHRVPPPWLIAMQRYGPPPSYPNLKIPGLNGPIPEGCSFGYHAGGWGKPPVDNMGKPIYGDVFGTVNKEVEPPMPEEEVERSHWGELESESEDEDDSDEESSEASGAEDEQTGLVTPGGEGLATPSGVTSLPAGLETPDIMELRKKQAEGEGVEGGDTPSLYTVLPERRAEGGAGRAMMASTHTYDLSQARGGGVDVALDPSELDLDDTQAMEQRYEEQVRQQRGEGDELDFSDMVAAHNRSQGRQRKRKLQTKEQDPRPAKSRFKF